MPRPLLALLALLSGCSIPDSDTGAKCPVDSGGPADSDGDGFALGVDCDDMNGDVGGPVALFQDADAMGSETPRSCWRRVQARSMPSKTPLIVMIPQ